RRPQRNNKSLDGFERTNMSFRDYLQSHYVAACELQRSDDLELDTEIVAMLQHGPPAPDLVKRWMRNYGLFQGITNQQRSTIVERFLEFANSRVRTLRVSEFEKAFND